MHSINSALSNQDVLTYPTASGIGNQGAMRYVNNTTSSAEITSSVGQTGASSSSGSSSSGGSIATIGVGAYWDSSLRNSVTAINWGNLAVSVTKSFTIYICNKASTPLILSLSTSNWNPSSVHNYLTLTWSYNRQLLVQKQLCQ